MGCDTIQGYLISKPLDFSKMQESLEKGELFFQEQG